MSAQQDTAPASGGKGSFPRIWNSDTFRNNFVDINWGPKPSMPCSCTAFEYIEKCPVQCHANVAKQARLRRELEAELERNTKRMDEIILKES